MFPRLRNPLSPTATLHPSPTKRQIDHHARRHGFPDSDYPWCRTANRCGEGSLADLVPNGWYPVDFGAACNAHDRCYLTLGSDRGECDRRFLADLEAAVERDLGQRTVRLPNIPGINPLFPVKAKIVRGGFRGRYRPTASDRAVYKLSEVAGLVRPVPLPPGAILPRSVAAVEPTSLVRGKAVAGIYHGVVHREGGPYHRESQEAAARYDELVRAFVERCEHAEPLRWVAAADGSIPVGAEAAGHEGYGEPPLPLHVARGRVDGVQHVGKVRPEFGAAHLPHGGGEHPVTPYEVLTGTQHWVEASGGSVPPNAFVAGTTASGRPFHVARGTVSGGLHIGELEQGSGFAVIPCEWKAVEVRDYEVLVTVPPE